MIARNRLAVLEIDGAFGEGGGQLVRTAVALSAISGIPIRVNDIRARRMRPGLAPQHLAAIHAIADLCSANTEGLRPGSEELFFAPGPIEGGSHVFDVGTAGSVTLVLQALLPVMTAARSPVDVRITGETDVMAAPPLDYFLHVLMPILQRFGVDALISSARRGYFPKGGGEVDVLVTPSSLRGAGNLLSNTVRDVQGIAHTANLHASIAERMRDAALASLGDAVHADIRVSTGELAFGAGGAIVVWADSGTTRLGAGRVAQPGVRAETLGQGVAEELRADLAAGAGLDRHAADQVLVYAALASGPTSYRVREVTEHARTVMWLIEQFFAVQFRIAERAGETLEVRIEPPHDRESLV
ncbi:MAG: RNA 3'-terminal phosphate cyclase [Burkholderiales bacterium]